MPQLVLGPLLRYVGSTTATVWVETDAPCTVEVLGHEPDAGVRSGGPEGRSPTFHVEGHHYGLVLLEDLEPGTERAYEVHLDGERVWPQPGDPRPPSVIRTRQHEDRARLVFGSCRVAAPHAPPYTLPKGDHPDAHGVDALRALSQRMQARTEPPPDCLLLLGDQVYADEVSPGTLEFIRQRRDVSVPPGEEIADFEEYTRLYRESWSDPDIRWLLATVPSTMIFDDHDLCDDWNISEAWVAEMRRRPWWDERVVGAFMSYWIYQHLGNLSPPELAEETLLAQLRQDADGGSRLRAFARMADRESAASRWAYHRDFSPHAAGGGRLPRRLGAARRGGRDIAVDAPMNGRDRRAHHGDIDHLIIASTLPVFMIHGVHHLEAWNEAVCAGAQRGPRRQGRSRAAPSTWSTGRRSSARSPAWSTCWARWPRGRTPRAPSRASAGRPPRLHRGGHLASAPPRAVCTRWCARRSGIRSPRTSAA
ncbi:MAG: alkaline phosphatase D family protein [Thermoleophilia bacterium]